PPAAGSRRAPGPRLPPSHRLRRLVHGGADPGARGALRGRPRGPARGAPRATLAVRGLRPLAARAPGRPRARPSARLVAGAALRGAGGARAADRPAATAGP